MLLQFPPPQPLIDISLRTVSVLDIIHWSVMKVFETETGTKVSVFLSDGYDLFHSLFVLSGSMNR